MTRVYILGPMTGLERKNHPAFYEAEAYLKSWGYHVENPARNRAKSWFGYMRKSMRQMLTCDAVACLPGWEHSPGASKEKTVADWLGMTVLYL